MNNKYKNVPKVKPLLIHYTLQEHGEINSNYWEALCGDKVTHAVTPHYYGRITLHDFRNLPNCPRCEELEYVMKLSLL